MTAIADLGLAPWPTHRSARGMVASIDHLASSAGVLMLRQGGSAVDAALAANAVLTVVAPGACGLGGDLFALVGHAGERVPQAWNASGHAPAAANPAHLRDEGLELMPLFGDVRAATVPGAAAGWVALHDAYGRLRFADVLAPAIDLAENGFAMSAFLAATLANRAFASDPAAADLFSGSSTPRPGSVIRRPATAAVLRDLADDGVAGFYEGRFGEAVCRFAPHWFTAADLRAVRAERVEALHLNAFGHTLSTIPPNSQGYITLAACWLAERLDPPTDPAHPDLVHVVLEALKAASFDRDDVLADPDAGGAPAAELLDPARLEARLGLLDRERAARLGVGAAAGDTIYLCAVDAVRGQAVSLIQSNFHGYGTQLPVPGTGIFLQNRGASFSLEPGHPNELAPGKRPRHTLSPAFVTGPGVPLLPIGTMGGESQPMILAQILTRMLHCGQEAGAALAWPRAVLDVPGAPTPWHGRGAGVVVSLEEPGSAWAEPLRERGHDVELAPGFSHAFGHAHTIGFDGASLAGAADPRSGHGAAVGW